MNKSCERTAALNRMQPDPETTNESFLTDKKNWANVRAAEKKRNSVADAMRTFFGQSALRIGVYPKLDSLYQSLMLAGAGTPERFVQVRNIKAIEKAVRKRRIWALWINWDEKLIYTSPPERQMQVADEAVRVFSEIRAQRVRICITVHNAQPHDRCDMKAFEHLRGYLVRNSDAVHVHSEAAAEMLVKRYDVVPARVHVVPHPSYVGFFPVPVHGPPDNGRERQRFLSFGAVRAYKGIEGIALAFRDATVPQGALTIAGRPHENYDIDMKAGLDEAAVTCDFRSIPDEEVPELFARHDWLVLNYQASLTSGAAMMGLTFGLPVIAPDIGGMREMLPGILGNFLFRAGDRDGLRDALARAAECSESEWQDLHRAALARADETHPGKIARRFKKIFDALELDGPSNET